MRTKRLRQPQRSRFMEVSGLGGRLIETVDFRPAHRRDLSSCPHDYCQSRWRRAAYAIESPERPNVRLTIRPRFTASRALTRVTQRIKPQRAFSRRQNFVVGRAGHWTVDKLTTNSAIPSSHPQQNKAGRLNICIHRFGRT